MSVNSELKQSMYAKFLQLEVLPYQLFIFYEYEVLNEKKMGMLLQWFAIHHE